MSEAVALLEAREPNAKYLAAAEPALVRGFELFATAQGGVSRLRGLIRSLAVRGRLVRHEPGDDPVTMLLLDIRATKSRLVAAGKLRAVTMSGTVSDSDRPFSIPVSWVWAQFGSISINRDGERIPVSSEDRQYRAKVYDYYGASGVIDKIDGYLFDKTLLLIGEDGANLINRSTAIAFLASGKYWVNNHAHVVDTTHPTLTEFLCLFINAISLEPYITGTAQPKMNQAKLNSIPVALPPLAEQHRIVARVEELMKLCDALEQSGRLADEQHARLTSTLFDALAASESAQALAENWQRVAEHFDLLLDRPETIDAFEQAILDMAIRGRLVPQDAREEPATELLRKVRAERDRSIATKSIRADRSLPAIAEEETPYELPEGWAWARLGQMLSKIGAGSTPLGGKDVYTANGVKFLRSQNVWNDGLRLAGVARIPPSTHSAMSGTAVQANDLLFNITGASIGRCSIVPADFDEANVSQHVTIVRPAIAATRHFLHLALISKHVQQTVRDVQVGVSREGLSIAKLGRFVIPVPPLAEQHRIVARVEEICQLCADLRWRLSQAQAAQSSLADALVAEVT